MKKYNRPEIEALTLETIDVIASSGNVAAEDALKSELGSDAANGTISIEEQFDNFTTGWSW